MVFCPKCGEKQDNNEAKFCQKCGEDIGANNKMHNNHLSNNLNCIYCGSEISDGSDKCSVCGKYLDPKANENFTFVIILGYVCSILALLLSGNIFFAITGVIMGVYLITRKNSSVHNHGKIIIIISVIDLCLAIGQWCWFWYLW